MRKPCKLCGTLPGPSGQCYGCVAWRVKLRCFYGVEPEEYDAVLKAQSGKCFRCGKKETARSRTGSVFRLGVYLDPVSEKLKGLICHSCHATLIPRVKKPRVQAERKKCSTCGVEKPAYDFSKQVDRVTGLASQCVDCMRLTKARSAEKHPWTTERRRRYVVEWQYGLSPEQLEAMIITQGNKCAICKEPETATLKMPGMLRKVRELSVDHDHSTGKTRGLLCARCNHALGHIEKSPHLLRAWLDYLFERGSAGAETLRSQRPKA